jgi:hypothetical protein
MARTRQLTGIISAAAFSFIVQDQGDMLWHSERSRDSSRRR